ncbi:cupin domain-containing protein [Fusarium napiforme]|uniref:Cupin domain-containing protein n=1 Tax=Fusarium napiforme TaxID=42672 RepID=A0A8H5IDR7_9HYPO|nr:cupin domain-containing protein [Fusarium napiforme]
MSPSEQESSKEGITAIVQPVKRYITGRGLNTGESIYRDATELCAAEVPGFGAASRSYATLKLPAKLADDQDLKAHLSHDSPTSYTWSTEFLVPSSGLNTQTG